MWETEVWALTRPLMLNWYLEVNEAVRKRWRERLQVHTHTHTHKQEMCLQPLCCWIRSLSYKTWRSRMFFCSYLDFIQVLMLNSCIQTFNCFFLIRNILFVVFFCLFVCKAFCAYYLSERSFKGKQMSWADVELIFEPLGPFLSCLSLVRWLIKGKKEK